MELGYEPARKEDIEALFEFNRELIEKYEDPGSIDLQEVLAWVRRKLEKRLDEYVRVTADGRLAGYCRICLDGGEAELDDLYILPEYRGRGIGTAAVEKCCADAGRPVKLYVFAKNEKAVSLYRKLGFEITEKVGETRYIMRRGPEYAAEAADRETEDGKMKEIEIFYLKGCPYCMKARKAVEELQAENAAYAGLELRWIEESENPGLADSRDYYNVPSLFYGGEKLYEAKPLHGYDMIKGSIRSAFDKVLAK
ncbi:MAG: GNAT family N-acetyltransferase [Oscillospiraceae bacterium]|nr:GNAT family N-acetyltransferase [Oscillospiraceae bacterium]